MVRKAKERAQQKIGIWTSSNRRNMSTKENANTSNIENRAPLQTQSQSAINQMKNVSVRLERMDPETLEQTLFSQPKPVSVVEKIFKKDANTDNKNVYDYSFDTDAIPLETENQDAMKDLIDKLAKENKIVVKKYRAKGVKRQPGKKQPVHKGKAQKRRREKQPAEIEPPQKKPNLKNQKVNNIVSSANPVTATTTRASLNVQNLENNNNLKTTAKPGNQKTVKDNIENIAQKPSISSSTPNPINSSLTDNSAIAFARLRLRNRDRTDFQSTPKSSTPLNTKAGTVCNSNVYDESPIVAEVVRLAQADKKRQRLRLSNVSNESSPSTSVFDDVDVHMVHDFVDNDHPVTSDKIDKENSFNALGTSAAANYVTKQNNNLFQTSDENSTVFSPTKRRVYGRSPLKNITSEVNNTFDSIRSIPSISDSFGSIPRPSSALLSRTVNSSKETTQRPEVTLPEADYLVARRSSTQSNQIESNDDINVDNCFGFDDDDDTDDVSELASEAQIDSKGKIEAEKAELQSIRANLKRFLQNPDSTESISKKTKTTSKNAPKRAEQPKKIKTPVKTNAKVIFSDTHSTKQKDIRNAFSAKPNDKVKSNDNLSAALFEEIETVQDRRKSYSRPARQYRKRRISIDSEPEDNDDSDEEYGEDGKKTKTKRRKKLIESNPKENEDLVEYVKVTNAHFEDVDQFELVVE